MNYLRVKNWEEFQHYKDRLPPWIKLHRELLTDYEFCQLPDESKAHLMLIWLLASQMDGRVPNDPKFIGQRIGATMRVDLHRLIQHGWLQPEHDASTALAGRQQDAIAETEAYKQETEAETEARERPGWLPAEAWADYCAYRKQQKGWTRKGEALSLKTLGKLRDAGHDPVAVIEQSIANGWKGLFPLRGGGGGKQSLAERAVSNLDVLTGRVRNERTIVAERVGGSIVQPVRGYLREPDGTDVEGGGPARSAAGMGG